MKDKCVLCGKETPYDKETPINKRRGYIEGCGQTCPGGCEQNRIIIDAEPEGRTGYELFRYIPQNKPKTPAKWEINLFWFTTGLVTSAIVVFIIYQLSKMIAL